MCCIGLGIPYYVLPLDRRCLASMSETRYMKHKQPEIKNDTRRGTKETKTKRTSQSVSHFYRRIYRVNKC
jgi:hypothetical protein